MWIRLLLLVVIAAVGPISAHAEGMRIGDICRIKGQEDNTLQGLGLVVGLRGTGDGDAKPTARALARMMQLMGGQISTDALGQLTSSELKDAKNVALVFVTATVPGVGAQQGDQIDVSVNAIHAKSLDGGYLMLTPLLGPRADNPTVYAIAQGRIAVAADGPPTTARIQGGCKMETTIKANYQLDGKITLILDRDFANFDTSQRIEDAINDLATLDPNEEADSGAYPSQKRPQAKAIDQLHVEVQIPELYRENPIKFISLLLIQPVALSSHSNRVVINERDGVVVIGEDVEIAPVLVTHRNLRIEAGGGAIDSLVKVSDNRPNENAKLKALADALNALDVPTDDLIAIIKTLKRKGDLYGEVVFE